MKENKQGNLMDFLLEIEPIISKPKPKPQKLTEKRTPKISTAETKMNKTSILISIYIAVLVIYSITVMI